MQEKVSRILAVLVLVMSYSSDISLAMGLAITIATVLFSRENAIFYRHVLISVAFCFGMILLVPFDRRIPNCLVWVGRHSYEIFILHFALIWMIFRG